MEDECKDTKLIAFNFISETWKRSERLERSAGLLIWVFARVCLNEQPLN